MFAKFLTYLMAMNASFGMHNRRCLRGLTQLLFVLALFSFGGAYTHFSITPHVHSSVTGQVIHLDANSEFGEHYHKVDTFHHQIPDGDQERCPIVELFAHVAEFSPSSQSSSLVENEIVLISKEVRFRQLEIVYFSHRALEQAPKHSPPLITG